MRLFKAFLIIALCWQQLFGAIAFDAATVGTCEACSSKTVTHTATGANLYAVVGVGLYGNTVTVTGVTCDGVAMSLIRAEPHSTENRTVELWGKAGCATGVKDYIVTLSGSNNGVVVGVSTFTGVHQTTPTGTPNSAESTGALPVTVTVTSAVGELVIDATMMYDTAETLTVDASQTERYHGSSGTWTESGGSTEVGAANVTMSWTNTSNDAWVIAAVSLKPVTEVTRKTMTTLGVGP